MKRKLQNTISKWAWPACAVVVILLIWQGICSLKPEIGYMLPSPVSVVKAFVNDFPILMGHSAVTLAEALIGLFFGVALGFIMAFLMERFQVIYKAFYPLIIVTQTIPSVAIAPLLVLWFGYEMMPKVILIVLTTFFPITVGLFNGFRGVDKDNIDLMRAMGASKRQIFKYIKLPAVTDEFFAGLKISTAYAVVGAVISEWLGGFNGLGVYMTRVKKAYMFDRMFAVIVLISIISLVMIKCVEYLHIKCTPWKKEKE